MAHVLSLGDIVEFSPVCLTLNQYTFNVFHFVVTSVTGTTVTDQDVGADLDNLVAPFYKSLLPTNCSYYGSKVQTIKPVRYDPTYRSTNRGAGTIAGDCLPTQVAGLTNLKTGVASRRTRGRFYMPATAEDDSTAVAQPSAGYVTALQNLNNALFSYTGTTVGAANVFASWIVYSRTGLSYLPVTSYTVRTNWATQRKRSQIKHADSAPF